MNSLEYRILIVRGYYEQYLGRDAGSDELNFWANALGAGVTRQQMLAGFISSSEYMTRAGGTVAGLVNQAWNDVLGHGALAENVSYWQGRADAGEDIRLALAQGLLNSQEYFTRRDQCAVCDVLAPSGDGACGWIGGNSRWDAVWRAVLADVFIQWWDA